MTKKEIIKRLKQIEQLLDAPREDETVKKCLERKGNTSRDVYPIICGVVMACVSNLLEDLENK